MNEDEFERSHQIGVVPKKKPIRKVEKGRIGIKRSSKAKESEDDEEYKPWYDYIITVSGVMLN